MKDTPFLTGQVSADGSVSQWPLNQDELLIGREAPADLVVPRSRVSRRHACITRSERGCYLEDLDSRNGTFVNGQPVTREPRRLQHGDEIVLGGVVSLRFHDPGETTAGPRIGRLRGVWLDEDKHEVWVDGKRLDPPPSPAQFALLRLLDRSAGQVVTRDQIIAGVWPDVDAGGVSEEAIDGLIKRVRARLREAQPAREYLETVRGHGVRLVQPNA